MKMNVFRIGTAPLSAKLMMTVLLCMIGLTYIAFLLPIYYDTEMKPSIVEMVYHHEGEWKTLLDTHPELTVHVEEYLPYYTLYLLAAPTIIFMFSSYSEKLKRVLAVLPSLFIVLDIGSMWMIPFYSKTFFTYLLCIAGMLIATSFLVLFLLNIFDIWLKKQPAATR